MIDQRKRENESLKLSVQYAKRKMTVECVQNLIPLYTGLPNIRTVYWKPVKVEAFPIGLDGGLMLF